MDSQRRGYGGFFLLGLVLLLLLAGCSGGSGGSGGASGGSPDISGIQEMSSASADIAAASGGTVTLDAVTAAFPAGILPADTRIKISRVSVLGEGVQDDGDDDAIVIDLTDVYTISATSAADTVVLTDSANITFRVNPAGFDPDSIRLVVWDGYEWDEVPASYDEILGVVSATAEAIMPFGTRIYLANPGASSTSRREGGEQIVSQFVAMKVVGELSGSAASQNVSSGNAVARGAAQGNEIGEGAVVRPGRTVVIKSPQGKFTVTYKQVKDSAQAAALQAKADEVAGYMDNAYEKIVVEMKLKKPGPTTSLGYGKTWYVELTEMSGVYGTADAGKFEIAIASNSSSGDGLAHTCHHEFTHLVQFQTLKEWGNSVEDSLDWFGETMADAIGYYAMKGLGTVYSLPGERMGDFDWRLDADKHTLGDQNQDFEYQHYPFISYLLAIFGNEKFKAFFETWYSYKPGYTQINMDTIDTAALSGFAKKITGRDGIFWDFYKDYFISGTVFNKGKFKNLPNREAGKPYDVQENETEKQGVTLIEIKPGMSYQKEFTMQRLSGQTLILRYKGSSSMDIDVKVTSAPGQSSGRIELNSFKRVGGILSTSGAVKEVSDGATKTEGYTGIGTDIHDIYLLMVNTTCKADDYKVTVVVTEDP